MCLIYLSPVPWASFAQRPHKFVEWFHQRTGRQVLWVEPYPTRFPKLGDFKRCFPAKKLAIIDEPSWLRVFSPHALPLEPLPGSGCLNGWLWTSLIRDLRACTAEQEAWVVVGKPSILALQVLKAVKPRLSIYDAMDDFPAFYSGLSRMAMARRESQLARRVDKIWASSTVLKDYWLQEGSDVCLVPNALDASVLPSPRREPSKGKKVFGYVGTIGVWFDWEWVFALARARPSDVIRLIGPVLHSAPFGLPKNVELLPPCHHAVALNAMREFDVSLIPFKRNELTESVDPIKYYEYRALGLPVISTDFGEMRFRAGAAGTFICKAADEIELFAAMAIEFMDSPEACREFVIHNTWEARFDATEILS